MESLSISATSFKRPTISSRGSSRSGALVRANSSSRNISSSSTSQYKMDEQGHQSSPEVTKPIINKQKATRCYRPKEWTPEAEEAFRVQQTGWRDVKEYMENYGEPERWESGMIRCTRVKGSGFYTYWRTYRECDDKYLHTVKLYEYA